MKSTHKRNMGPRSGAKKSLEEVLGMACPPGKPITGEKKKLTGKGKKAIVDRDVG